MSQPKPPTPDPSGDYRKSLKVYMKYLPKLLEGEQAARTKYDPARIEEQLGLQSKYGPQMYAQQLAALKQLDPQGVAIRQQLGEATSRDLASGYNLPPGYAQELTSQIRGAEVARGNEVGNAAVSAEALYKGQAGINLYQQHLQNAGAFLAGATPEQRLINIQPVTPDRSSQYVNPSAPGQLAAPNYQNQLAAFQASSGRPNPWLSAGVGAAGGALSGALQGSVVPGWGTAVGAVAGGLVGGVGGYFGSSDERLKHNIVPVGFSERGYPIYEFNYNDCPGRFRGTIAQAILPLKPSAVKMDGTGFWKVDYGQLDIKLEEIPEEVYA